jgi:hypothetical protein
MKKMFLLIAVLAQFAVAGDSSEARWLVKEIRAENNVLENLKKLTALQKSLGLKPEDFGETTLSMIELNRLILKNLSPKEQESFKQVEAFVVAEAEKNKKK